MAAFVPQPKTKNNLITTDSVPSPPRADAELNKPLEYLSEPHHEKPQQSQSEFSDDSHFERKHKKKTTNTKSRSSKAKNCCAPIIISNSSGVHIGPNININCSNASNKDTNINQYACKTKNVEILLDSTKIINEEQIQFVSKHIGEGWRKVARILKYSDGQIHQVYADFKIDGLGEVIYQLLLGWYRSDPDKATLGTLADALWQSNEFEVVHKLTKYLN